MLALTLPLAVLASHDHHYEYRGTACSPGLVYSLPECLNLARHHRPGGQSIRTVALSWNPAGFVDGWTWLSYPLQSPATVADALQYNAQLGDQLKSQQAFTEYWGPDNGWFGTLTTLEPGQGYTLKAACAADGSCGNPRWVDVA